MRQTAFLEFNGPAIRHDHAEHALFCEIFEQCLEFQSKDTSNQIRSIDSILPGREIFSYFWPGRVGGDGNEVVRLSILPHDGQRILIVHLHGSGANHEATGQDYWAAYLRRSAVC